MFSMTTQSKHHSILTLLCGACILFATVLGVGTFSVELAQAKEKKRKTLPPPPPDLPGQVNYYTRQLAGVPVDESGPLAERIQKIVLDHLQEWFTKRNSDLTPTDVEVRRELENVFAKLHYPFFGQPAVFDQPWKGVMLIGAGYTLGWTDYDRVNVLAVFEFRGGKARQAAVTNFVPRTDLHYEFLPSEANTDFRFFVYGNRLGKSHPRLTAILYSFDGEKLKPLWETHDVYDGKMDVDKDQATLRYLKEEEYAREVAHRRKPPRHEAVYRITPQGLHLENDREIPF